MHHMEKQLTSEYCVIQEHCDGEHLYYVSEFIIFCEGF